MFKVNCVKCGVEIHPMRIEILPNTKVCVKCSDVSKKAGRLVSYGTGEEIETKLEIHEADYYRKISKDNKIGTNVTIEDLETLHQANEDKEDIDPYSAFTNISSTDTSDDNGS